MSQGHSISLDVATSNYDYDDGSVTIYIGHEVFKIGRSRLAQRSPVFRELFDIPQPADDELDPSKIPLPPSPSPSPSLSFALNLKDSGPKVLHLHNDPDDFRHYLWAIHADFIDVEDFWNEPASVDKCAKLLGIASVAHMYEVTAMANRSLELSLSMLESHTLHIDESLAFRVVHTSRRWADQPEIASRARLIIRAAMKSQRIDVFGVILIAEPLNDRELLGWGYYCLLHRGKDYWMSDARVRAIDRRRLLAGAFALSQKWLNLCRVHSQRGNSDNFPSSAIFDKIGTIYDYYGQVAPLRTELERTLYDFFDPEPWDL